MYIISDYDELTVEVDKIIESLSYRNIEYGEDILFVHYDSRSEIKIFR